MLNLLLKAVIAGLAAVGANTAWRAVSRSDPDPGPAPPAKAESSPPWPAAQLSRIEHDLRTPIGTIANTVELLRDVPFESDTGREACEVIERQVRRLNTLTSELHEILASHGRPGASADAAVRPRH